MAPDQAADARVKALQARIDRVLHEPLSEAGTSAFSSYMPGASTGLQDALLASTSAGHLAGLEAMLDEFDRLRPMVDAGALRHALSVVLTDHPAVAELGLRLPSLEERSPWKTWPSRRDPD